MEFADNIKSSLNQLNNSISEVVDTIKEKSTNFEETIEETIEETVSDTIKCFKEVSLFSDTKETQNKQKQTDENIELENRTKDLTIKNSNEEIESIDNKESIFTNISTKYESIKEEINQKLRKIILDENLPIPNMILNIGAGRLYELSEIPNLEKHFDDINKHKNGERLDNALENWKIKAGDREIEVITDNNIVSEEWKNKTGKACGNSVVLTSEMKNSINEAIQTLHKSGQNIPNKIYLTNIIQDSNKGAQFSVKNPNSIILFMSEMKNPEWIKNVIYHESAHLADYKIYDDYQFLSETKDIDIFPENSDYVPPLKMYFDNKQIREDDISSIISDKAAKNPKVLKSEIDKMINENIIIKDSNGKYSLDMYKYYIMRKNTNQPMPQFQETVWEKKFNNIMNLYNYVKENNINNFEYDTNPNHNVIKFNGKEINKTDIKNIISSYALDNPMEFVANVSSMITNGSIVQTKNGEYKLNTNEKGEYINSRNEINIIQENDNSKINDIMELYNYLTEGKVSRVRVVEE